MPLTDQARIASERRHPRLVDLWFALQPLRSVVRFMQSGAHPDDEISAMLATLAFRDGVNLSFACANRGEGGQNDIGTEATQTLGVLRTAEMERAADLLELRLYWLSESPTDSIFDFGFSKSGEETLAKWGHARSLARFVHIVRTERPDILCPTFLDVPGQHGHHRAMTALAHQVMHAAADPAFDSPLPPWQIAKLYLPAWSGAGQSYDDDLPPPPATLTVQATGTDPVTGWSYAHIGQQSRAFHLTQGMGRWVDPADERDWPLHLAVSTVPGPDKTLLSGLPATLKDLPETGPAAAALSEAQSAIDSAIAAFPDSAEILEAATEATQALLRAEEELADYVHPNRLTDKRAQLARVIRLAAGVQVHASLDRDALRPGQGAVLKTTVRHPPEVSVRVTPTLPEGWTHDGNQITPTGAARATDPYPDVYQPLAPRAPALTVAITALGTTTQTTVPFEVPPVLQPRHSLAVNRQAVVLNRAAGVDPIEVTLAEQYPQTAAAAFRLPKGWHSTLAPNGLRLEPPQNPDLGLTALPLTLDGAPAQATRIVNYPHTGPRLHSAPAALRVRVIDAEIPDAHVGYIGAGKDRVAHWLTAIGARVTEVDDQTLADPAAPAAFDTLIIGIFALRFRPGLAAAMPLLHAWTARGGTLLTLYHRPWDGWDPKTTAPKPLEIGQPSLRWRVTDEAAAVTHLIPDHPLLTTPNVIGPEDWVGWHKERGLYFAKSWDPAYQALLEMADPGEAPHHGALLSAEIGAGRHTHTSLILHHQMEQLTPGAFRLMANLIAPRR